MSLINDALKRASQAQKTRGTPAAPPRPLQPASSGTSSRNLLVVVVPLVAVALLATAGWFGWQWWKNHPASPSSQTAAAAPSAAVKPAETNLASPAIPATTKPVVNTNLVVRQAPVPGVKPAVAATVSATPKATTTAAATPPAAPNTNLAPVAPEIQAPVEFPPLKLQGIYFRMTKSSALINGQHLYVGDTVDNVKIIAVDRQSVTVEYRGQKKVLALR
jgi:hypothetical protein